MSAPKISVIVPFYNVEKYIGKCLKTIQNQTFTDYEVLLIDDESPDNSQAIAEKFVETDPRFKIFHKKNGGLSDARNYGIERATGDYIVFIDSDDYLHKDYLKTLYEACVDNDAEMAYCRFKFSYFNTGITFPMPFNATKKVVSNDKALKMLIKDNFLRSYAWNKIYKRELFTQNDIKYPIMFFEDIATSGRLVYNTKKVAITNKYRYYYVKRFGSIMATMDAGKINDYLRSLLIMRNYLEEQGDYDEYRSSIRFMAAKMHLVNKYSIFRQHVLHADFHNFIKNMKINTKLYRYIVSDDYKSTSGFPNLPMRLIQPGRKKKKGGNKGK